MNEGQIYRADCIKKAIEDIEMLVSEMGLAEHKYEIIMKNAKTIKHHAVSLSFKVDEWDRPE